ncbi:MAG: hypothetical protein ACI9QD_000533 [Thermoproteota archaeon]|jgi:hypothetical protein
MKLILIAFLSIFAFSALATENEQCKQKVKELQSLNQYTSNQGPDRMYEAMMKATERYEVINGADSIGYASANNLDNGHYFVVICDDYSGYIQGNCDESYYQTDAETYQIKLLAVTRIWHTGGDDETDYVCE